MKGERRGLRPTVSEGGGVMIRKAAIHPIKSVLTAFEQIERHFAGQQG